MILQNIEQLKSLSENSLRRDVIIPLLQSMGYQGVFEKHGMMEFGQDVVAWRAGDFGQNENIAVVAKASRIVGNQCHEVARQISQAFNSKFPAGIGNELRSVDKVWVVSNDGIPEIGREQVLTQVVDERFRSRIVFIDDRELWNAWAAAFPTGVQDFISEIQKRINSQETGYQPSITIDGRGVALEIRPETSSVHDEVGIEFRTAFSFPDTPEGRSKSEEIEKAWNTGSGFNVSSEYARLVFPPGIQRILEELFGIDPSGGFSITSSPIPDARPLPMRIEIAARDGISTVLEYVDLRMIQAGAKELTLSNDDQPIPIRVTFVIVPDEMSGRFKYEISDGPITASWLKKWADLKRCMSTGAMTTARLVSSGERVFSGSLTSDDDFEHDQHYYDLISDLARAETVLDQPIYAPDGVLTEKEKDTIVLIRNLLLSPKVQGTWSEATAVAETATASQGVEPFLNGERHRITEVREEIVELAGHEISLGLVTRHIEGVSIANPQEVVEEIRSAIAAGQETVSIRFTPCGDGQVVSIYESFQRESLLLNPEIGKDDEDGRPD